MRREKPTGSRKTNYLCGKRPHSAIAPGSSKQAATGKKMYARIPKLQHSWCKVAALVPKLFTLRDTKAGPHPDWQTTRCLTLRRFRTPRCLIPDFDGALFSQEWRDALWAGFYMAAPERQRRSVERYNIVMFGRRPLIMGLFSAMGWSRVRSCLPPVVAVFCPLGRLVCSLQ